MNILALDTSSKAASCAVTRDGFLVGEFFQNTALTHSQTILPMVQTLLDSTGMVMADIDLLAVSTGPGSFTGLRIGIAAVKGMAMALGKPCGAVSTLEALAQNLAVFSGIIVSVMDARRSQVYTAQFRCENGAISRLSDDTALSVVALGEALADPASGPVMLVGDGAVLCKEAMSVLAHVGLAPENLRYQRASSVASVAARLGDDRLCSAGELAPQYLRLPQAERERLARLER